MTAVITPLHRVELALVIRHLIGDPNSALDRVGSRHRRMVMLYCAGWAAGTAFAGIIKDTGGSPEALPLGREASRLGSDIWRSVRLRARRAAPTAVWHHPFPLETAADYATQHEALAAHLREHAARAGWAPDCAAMDDGNQRAPTAAAGVELPDTVPDWTPPRWSPDPDEPPRHIRVFPGELSHRGERYRVSERTSVDSLDGRLLMAFRRADGAELWLNESGRIVASGRDGRLRESSP